MTQIDATTTPYGVKPVTRNFKPLLLQHTLWIHSHLHWQYYLRMRWLLFSKSKQTMFSRVSALQNVTLVVFLYLDAAWTQDGIKHEPLPLLLPHLHQQYHSQNRRLFRPWTFKNPRDSECGQVWTGIPRDVSNNRGMVGCCNWLITLGHFDIDYATQALHRYSMAPRMGHFCAMSATLFSSNEVSKEGSSLTASIAIGPFIPILTLRSTGANFTRTQSKNVHQGKVSQGKTVQLTTFVDADKPADTNPNIGPSQPLFCASTTPLSVVCQAPNDRWNFLLRICRCTHRNWDGHWSTVYFTHVVWKFMVPPWY